MTTQKKANKVQETSAIEQNIAKANIIFTDFEKANSQIKAIDQNAKMVALKEKIKEAKAPFKEAESKALEALELLIVGLPIKEALQVANKLQDTPSGSDAVTRQRFTRRRAKLLKILQEGFTNYSISKEKQGNSVVFRADKSEAPEITRARAIMSIFSKYGEALSNGKMDVNGLAELIKTEEVEQGKADNIKDEIEVLELLTDKEQKQATKIVDDIFAGL